MLLKSNYVQQIVEPLLFYLLCDTKLCVTFRGWTYYVQDQEWANFFLGTQACNFTCVLDRACKKIGAQNQSACPIETQLETFFLVVYYPAFIFNVFPSKSSQGGLCSLNVVLTSKIRCTSKNKFHNLKAFA